MSRLTKIGTVSLLAAVILGLAIPVTAYLRRAPAALYIHLDSIECQSVTVESSNLPLPLRFNGQQIELKVSPISHGIYRITVELSSGQTASCEFLHHDVGARRRIDLTIAPSQTGFHFRQTVNQTKDLFDGDARIEEATREKPFRLDWI